MVIAKSSLFILPYAYSQKVFLFGADKDIAARAGMQKGITCHHDLITTPAARLL